MRTLGRISTITRQIAYAAGFALSVRFLAASINGAAPDQAPLVALGLGSIGVAVWLPRATMLAFLFVMPVLCGIGASGLLSTSQPATFIFSAIIVGLVSRWIFARFGSGWGTLEHDSARALAPASAVCRPSTSLQVGTVALVMASGSLIALVVTASFFGQVWTHPQLLGQSAFWQQPVFGFGDPFYFLTSALVWIQGLIFFSQLVSYRPTVSLRDMSRAVFSVFGCSLVLFVILQHVLWLPAPLSINGGISFAYTSPFEDIHSLGSFAVAGLMYALGTWSPRTGPQLCRQSIGILSWLAVTTLSWSRSSWLAGLVGIVLVAAFRMSRRWFIAVLLIGLVIVVVTNLNADRASWNHFSYVTRFISLIRIENPAQKDLSRVFLFRRALRMIGERPLVGHGIGSFRGASRRFADQADPDRTKSDFAHNLLLQFAAELGLPATLLFTGLLGTALLAGWGHLISNPGFAAPNAEVMGTTLALTSYLLTQLTANSLNVYPSNQFFFWFLLASLIASKHRIHRFRNTSRF